MTGTERLRLICTCALALGLAACMDAPVLEPELDPGDASFAKGGKKGGYSVVNVRDVGKPAGTPGAMVSNLADALDRVSPGGTIRIHPGTYITPALTIDKPVVIEAAGSTAPVLVPTEDMLDWLLIDGVAEGTVTLRGLDLRGEGKAYRVVHARGTYDQVVLEDVRIQVPDGEGNPVRANPSSVPGAAVTVRDSRIEGGRWAVWAARTHVEVSGSSLDGQSAMNVYLDGRPRPGVERTVTARIAGNTLHSCGQVCVYLSGDGAAEIVGNEIYPQAGGPTLYGVFVAGGGAEAVVSGNRIEGQGGIADRNDRFTYPVAITALLAWDHATVTATGNDVSSAAIGYSADGYGHLSGHDNRATTTWISLTSERGGTFEMHRSDFVDAVRHTSNQLPDGSGPNPWAEGALSCNWWGSPAGPTGPVFGTLPASVYEPVATQPIAGEAGVGCG